MVQFGGQKIKWNSVFVALLQGITVNSHTQGNRFLN